MSELIARYLFFSRAVIKIASSGLRLISDVAKSLSGA